MVPMLRIALALALASLSHANCGPWIPISSASIPRADPSDVVQVYYLLAPLEECADGGYFGQYGIDHSALAFRVNRTGATITVNMDAYPTFSAAIAPRIDNSSGYPRMVLQNGAGVYVYDGLNATYWTSGIFPVLTLPGALYNSFVTRWLPSSNATFTHYDLFRILTPSWNMQRAVAPTRSRDARQHLISRLRGGSRAEAGKTPPTREVGDGRVFVDETDCFAFCWAVLTVFADCGYVATTPTLQRTWASLYTNTDPTVLNVSPPTDPAVMAAASWFQMMEQYLKGGYEDWLRALLSVIQDGAVYTLHGTHVLKVEGTFPYLWSHFTDDPVPQGGGKCVLTGDGSRWRE